MLSPISVPHTTKGFTTYYYKMCHFKMNMNCCRHQTLKIDTRMLHSSIFTIIGQLTNIPNEICT